MLKKIKCRVCGKEIIALNGDQLRRKYCSNKCRSYFNNRNSKNKKNYCLDCGKQILLNAKRCVECAFKKRDVSGDKNGRWRGGTSEGYQISIYRGILRDNGIDINKCANCGIVKEKTKRMCIHHIDWNHKNNNLDNLIPLCSKCHLNLHLNKEKKAIVCKFCKNTFYVIPSKEKIRKFCSKKCSNRFYNEFRKGINDHKFRNCINCGKLFGFPPSRIKRGDGCKFCSKKCHQEHRRKDKKAMKKWHEKMLKLRLKKKSVR